MSRTRRAAVSLLAVALLWLGATSATGVTADASFPAVDHHRLTHVHDFASELMRLSPPTGTPRLTWQDAYRRYLHNGLFGQHRSARMPLVELATLRPNPTMVLPDRVLVWVVVPDAEVVTLGGPDYGALGVKPPQTTGRCPAYTIFDATTGRALVAFQTCEPPFRG